MLLIISKSTRILAGFLLTLSLLLSSAAVVPGSVVHGATQATFYVDPVNGLDTNNGTSTTTAFKTIEKARDVVRTINATMTGDIIVYLRGGTYLPTSTIQFTDADSGKNGFNVIYSAYNNEKPVISGGKPITGWTLYDAGKNIYRASAGGNIETRQLYVNGTRATRARSAGGTSSLTFVKASGYTATGSVTAGIVTPMHNWGNQSDIEFVYKIVWTTPRAAVSSITNDGTTTTINMDTTGWGYVTSKGGTSVGDSANNANGVVWYVENAYELLDAEGEWYLDRSTDYIYYKPRANEDISSSEIIAPVLEELVRVQGADLDHKASNIQFYGITFAHATWLRPNTYGQSDAQNNVIRESGVEQIIGAAVNLKYANAVKFERNVFEHLGSNGLNMYAGSQNNLVVGSRFTDISGGGIQIGDYLNYKNSLSENYAATSDTRNILLNNDVTNSYFANIGKEFMSATAIAASFPQDTDITHNEIVEVPYSGIHIGWGWTAQSTIIKNIHIENNYIHGVNMVLDDGGGIYTNGATIGDATTKAGYFNNNYIANVNNVHGYAMYNDEGSSWYEWNNNVINGAAQYAFTWRSHDNTYNNTYTNVSGYTLSSTGVNNTINNTTLVTGGNWPAAALAIMNNAGLESAYADIKPPVTQFYENFNSMSTGNAPAGWTINNAGGDGTVSVQAVPSTTDKSLQLLKTSTASDTYLIASHGFTPLYSGTVEVRAKASQTNAYIWPIYLMSGSALPIEVRFNNNGQIAYRNSSGIFTDIQAYTAGTWYDFKVEFNTNTDTYNLYIDSVQKLTNAAFAQSSGPIDMLKHQIYRQSTGTGYMDNVKVTEGSLRYDENFNSMTTGNAPAGWTIDNANGDGTVNVQDIPSSTDKSMVLTKSSIASDKYLIASRKFTPITKGTVEVRAKASQTNAFVWPIALKAGPTTAIEIRFNNNGQIHYNNSSGIFTNIQAYTAGTWYDFKVEFNTETDTYDLYIDSVKKLSNVAFAQPSGSIDMLKTQIYRQSTGTGNFDNIKITEIP